MAEQEGECSRQRSRTVGWEVKRCNQVARMVWQLLKRLDTHLPHNSSHPQTFTLRNYSQCAQGAGVHSSRVCDSQNVATAQVSISSRKVEQTAGRPYAGIRLRNKV